MGHDMWGVYYRTASMDWLWCEQVSYQDALLAANALNETNLTCTYGTFTVKRITIA